MLAMTQNIVITEKPIHLYYVMLTVNATLLFY